MRILVVCDNLDRGGTQRVVRNFTLAYHRAGHATAVLTRLAGGPMQPAIEAAGVPIIGVGDNLARAIEQVDEFNPELIHIHRPGVRNDFETRLLKLLRRDDRRIVETNVFARVDYSDAPESIDIHFHLTDWCLWRWRKWLGRNVARHVGIVVPNAVDVSDFVPAPADARIAFRAAHGIPSDAYLCGRIGGRAGANFHPMILHAFAAVAKRDPGAHMIIIGVPDPIRPLLESFPPDIRLRMHEVPSTDSSAALAVAYSSLDCFLHSAPSGESFGMALTEAMLCGCPVVTSSRPYKSNSQVIVADHMRAGLVAGSAAHLPDAALRMWSDAPLRRKLAAFARESVVSRFDSDRVADQAVRAGQIALDCGDRATLSKRLENAGFKTQMPDAEIKAILHNTLGGPHPLEVAAMHVIHLPAVHRMAYEYLKWRYYRKFETNA